MPPSVSPKLSDLINNLLQPLPVKRYTLEDVWSHPWVTGIESPFDEYQIPEYVNHFLQAKNKYEDLDQELVDKLYEVSKLLKNHIL